ncbi:GNAT family N-acetyltransferase [Nonomuraea sp. NPDC049758]|uniref:GNAT family N-acetyltransferase n=1 Tax=Nonomuraea sp. NPDC049758 TaxID=3154360 RepID=UPI00343F6B75
MSILIRAAVPADLDWINSNDQEWIVQEHHQRYGFSLEDAFRVDVATNERGERLGWTYVLKDDEDDYLVLHLLYVDLQHRGRGVARALVDHLAREPYEIVLGAWDRDFYDMWLKLGFVYEPHEHDRPGDLSGTMARPASGVSAQRS